MADRNHPSIVIYSVGNEIRDNLNDTSGFRKYKMQQDLIHELDGTRPVTMALFRPGVSKVYENGFVETMDVVGQNYREAELVAAHEAKPARKVIGTENGHELAAWLTLRDKPYMSGQFLWTGIEYLGESEWPRVVNGSGFMDKTGELKNNGYQRQSWWSSKPMVHLMRSEGNAGSGAWVSDWTPSDFDTYDEARLQVFSNCDEVELFLNDKSLGVKGLPEDKASPRTWTTTFQKGTIKAVARNGGKVVAEQVLKTAGNASKIILTADKPTASNDWNDVVFITASVTDDDESLVRAADNKITFTISGPGVIAAVDNANLTSTESFQGKERLAYKGKCIAIIKASADKGKIIITAPADGLKSGSVSIDATEKK
jgi:beta-galactosidase